MLILTFINSIVIEKSTADNLYHYTNFFLWCTQAWENYYDSILTWVYLVHKLNSSKIWLDKKFFKKIIHALQGFLDLETAD